MNLENFNKINLIKIIKDYNLQTHIKGYSKMKKVDLISEIKKYLIYENGNFKILKIFTPINEVLTDLGIPFYSKENNGVIINKTTRDEKILKKWLEIAVIHKLYGFNLKDEKELDLFYNNKYYGMNSKSSKMTKLGLEYFLNLKFY